MLKRVVEAVAAEFTLDMITRTTRTAAFRISPLDHEALDNTMENDAIIEAFLNEGYKIGYNIRQFPRFKRSYGIIDGHCKSRIA